MTAAITGGRNFEPCRSSLAAFLDMLLLLAVTRLVHGARGAVDWGVSTLVRYSLPAITVDPYSVDPAVDGPWPVAGCRRNGRMLRDANPAILFGFKGNNGTSDCIRQATRLGVTICRWDRSLQEWVAD